MTNRIAAILTPVSQRVEKLIPADRFYVAMYNMGTRELSFPLVKDRDTILSENTSPWIPRSCDPQWLLDTVILSAENRIYANELEDRLAQAKLHYWPEEAVPHSWLGVPLKHGENVLGALVVESRQKTYSFTKDHEQTLVLIARQTAIALDNVRLTEQLERKIDYLRTLNQIGQQLTKGLVKTESEIVELLYEGILKLRIDTKNMYIAFYDRDPRQDDTLDKAHGTLRFALRFKDGERVFIENRPAEFSRFTRYIIREKKTINLPNAEETHLQDASDHRGRRPKSFMGVPMLSEGDVFGVIVLRDYARPQAYTADVLEMLEILAGQTAVTLQNLRFYQAQQRAQEEKTAAENMAVMSLMAAEFAHKMNNLAGAIPVRLNMVRDMLNANESTDAILAQLAKIETQSNDLLRAAQEIRESSRSGPKEETDVNMLLGIAIARAQNTQINRQAEIAVKTDFLENISPIEVERNDFLDVLTSIIKNSYEAIDDRGQITIVTRQLKIGERSMIEIEITDTGVGIPATALPKVFDLFYTTKEEKGLGFGLWRDRLFLRKLGGDIEVQSELDKGSTFTLRIPIKQRI